MMYLVGVLLMVVGIGVSIALHEIGHLIPAKRFGVVCRQYMIGFGPTLFSRTRGGTEYGVKAIPLGGYVRMIGMYPPRGETSARGPMRSGRWSAMIDDARQASMEEVRPGEENRVFYRLSTPKKLVVMLGGPLMNLALAAVIITGVITLHGQNTLVPGAEVKNVAVCLQPAGAAATPCTASDAPSPAAAAGLRTGDRIVSVDGHAVNSPADVAAAVRPAAGRAVPVVIHRGGEQQTLTVTPAPMRVPVNAAGEPVPDPAQATRTTTVGYLGVSSGVIVEPQRQPITAAPAIVAEGVTQTAGVIIRLPEKLVGVWHSVTGAQDRDQTGLVSVVGVGRIAGEAADGQYAELTTSDLIVFLLLLIASLNIALFVFNLIPLLPLDGGHVAGALWEGLKRVAARAFGRPDPGHVDVAKGLPIAYAVSILLIGMSVLLMYADIVKPIRLG